MFYARTLIEFIYNGVKHKKIKTATAIDCRNLLQIGMADIMAALK